MRLQAERELSLKGRDASDHLRIQPPIWILAYGFRRGERRGAFEALVGGLVVGGGVEIVGKASHIGDFVAEFV